MYSQTSLLFWTVFPLVRDELVNNRCVNGSNIVCRCASLDWASFTDNFHRLCICASGLMSFVVNGSYGISFGWCYYNTSLYCSAGMQKYPFSHCREQLIYFNVNNITNSANINQIVFTTIQVEAVLLLFSECDSF